MTLRLLTSLFCLVLAVPALANPLDNAVQDEVGDEQVAQYCASLDDQLREPGVEDPLAATRTLYGEGMELPERATGLTPRLRDLFIRDDRRVCELDTPIGRLDFDWVVNGQDALISEVQAERAQVTMALADEPERMVVTVRFKNFDSLNVLDYYWEKGADGWRLDDVTSRGDWPWTLSLLLAYGI